MKNKNKDQANTTTYINYFTKQVQPLRLNL